MRFFYGHIGSPGEKPEYVTWIFDCDAILHSQELPEIPFEKNSELVYNPNNGMVSKGRRGVNWLTEVKLFNFTKDSSLSAVCVNDLRSSILGHFSKDMRVSDITVTIKICRVCFPYRGKIFDNATGQSVISR